MINYNGKITQPKLVHSLNRAFKYADALFETLKVTNLKIQFSEDHYFRLMASMRMLRMEIPMHFNLEFFESEILKTLKENNLTTARVRLTVYRKGEGLYLPKENDVNYVIEVSNLPIFKNTFYEVDLYKDFYVTTDLLATLKTTSKQINILASIYASENNLDNCILLNTNKYVSEFINGNFFMVKDKVVKTPSLNQGCVKGIIRKKVIELLKRHPEFTIEETQISPFEIQKADELFLTNAIVGILPINKYRKKEFSVETTHRLQEMLQDLV